MNEIFIEGQKKEPFIMSAETVIHGKNCFRHQKMKQIAVIS
jgi:hypothetical protein